MERKPEGNGRMFSKPVGPFAVFRSGSVPLFGKLVKRSPFSFSMSKPLARKNPVRGRLNIRQVALRKPTSLLQCVMVNRARLSTIPFGWKP